MSNLESLANKLVKSIQDYPAAIGSGAIAGIVAGSIIFLNSNRLIESIGETFRFVITPIILPIVERNLLPDFIIRFGIRREIQMELAKIRKLSVSEMALKKLEFLQDLRRRPIAIAQKQANEQHYEVPAEFYDYVMGPWKKYSCGLWTSPSSTLEESEVAMLELYCERAELKDGMTIVDLGCGWGSVTLFLATKYPNSQIVSISNSHSQREYIESQCVKRGLNNVRVFTGDISSSSFDLDPSLFSSWADRVISIEMFEHMKNYHLLMKKISNWMKPGGKLFVHIFTHKLFPSHYESGWMTETFFTGGTLPSHDTLLHFQDDLRIEGVWAVDGTHYQKTLSAWRERMEGRLVIGKGEKETTTRGERREGVIKALTKAYGAKDALKCGCEEFFGVSNGQEYIVSHYLFSKPN